MAALFSPTRITHTLNKATDRSIVGITMDSENRSRLNLDFDAVEINLLSSFFISQFRYYYEHQSKLANASSATNTMIRY